MCVNKLGPTRMRTVELSSVHIILGSIWLVNTRAAQGTEFLYQVCQMFMTVVTFSMNSFTIGRYITDFPIKMSDEKLEVRMLLIFNIIFKALLLYFLDSCAFTQKGSS